MAAPAEAEAPNHAAAFALADLNTDGFLCLKDLKAAFGFSSEEAASVIAFFARDVAKGLAPAEFELMARLLLDKDSVEAASVRPAFKSFDRDGSGRLDGKELAGMAASFKLPQDVFAKMVAKADLNHDGKIDAREFALLIHEISQKPEAAAAPAPAGPNVAPLLLAAAALALAAVFFLRSRK
jgi:Ca2+-binding EF-hand superfamily protein